MIGIMFAAAITAQQIEQCNSMEQYALAAAKAHQRGVPVSELMKHTAGDEMLQAIIIDATSITRYSTTEYQERESREFASSIANLCFKQIAK